VSRPCERRDFAEADLVQTVDLHDLSSSRPPVVPHARKEQCRSGIDDSIRLLSDPARHLRLGLANDQEDVEESQACEPSGSESG
jgi:hypothetical protein